MGHIGEFPEMVGDFPVADTGADIECCIEKAAVVVVEFVVVVVVEFVVFVVACTATGMPSGIRSRTAVGLPAAAAAVVVVVVATVAVVVVVAAAVVVAVVVAVVAESTTTVAVVVVCWPAAVGGSPTPVSV